MLLACSGVVVVGSVMRGGQRRWDGCGRALGADCGARGRERQAGVAKKEKAPAPLRLHAVGVPARARTGISFGLHALRVRGC